MKNHNNSKIGHIGELIAEKYLISKKHKILDKNFNLINNRTHKKIGEIDLIAKKGSVLVFVEVKSKIKNGGEGIPLEGKLNKNKKRRLIIVAESWLKKNKLPLTTARQIDIITIIIDINNKKARIKHYENALEEI